MQNKGIVSAFAVAVLCATSLVHASHKQTITLEVPDVPTGNQVVQYLKDTGSYVADKTTQVLDSKCTQRLTTAAVIGYGAYKFGGSLLASYRLHKAQPTKTIATGSEAKASVENATSSVGWGKWLKKNTIERVVGDEEYQAKNALAAAEKAEAAAEIKLKEARVKRSLAETAWSKFKKTDGAPTALSLEVKKTEEATANASSSASSTAATSSTSSASSVSAAVPATTSSLTI